MGTVDPISAALNIGNSIIERIWPDPSQQADAKLKLLALQQSGELATINAQSGVIIAEAQSESWLARSWRPILMLNFGFLITARWFGWSAPNLSEREYLILWEIVQLGIGGYVIGRSVEKIAPGIVEALGKGK